VTGGGGKKCILRLLWAEFCEARFARTYLWIPPLKGGSITQKKSREHHISVTESTLENDPLKPKWPLPLPPYQPLFTQPINPLIPHPRRKKDLFWGPWVKGKTKSS